MDDTRSRSADSFASPGAGGFAAGRSGRRTVGVIGGMGPAATVDFLEKLVAATAASTDQEHIRVLVDSDPSVPDRTAYLVGAGEDPRPILRRMASGLEQAGADLLVMPCNTAHAFVDDITSAVAIPLVDWPAIVADHLAAARCAAVGILATSGTVASGIYQRTLRSRGIQFVLPDEIAQDELMDAIYGTGGVKSSGPSSKIARRRLLDVGRKVAAAGADSILLACSELSALSGVRRLDFGAPAFDAAQIVARHVVRLAGGRLTEPADERTGAARTR